MGTDNDARQQTGVVALSRGILVLRRILATAVHPIVGLGKQIVVNDLQLRHIFRLGGFGDDVFGKRLAQSLGDGCYICADGGFASEIKPLIDAGVEVTLIRLHRAGYTFDGDSRSYIHGVCAREIDVRVVDCDIDGTSASVRHVINSTNC